MNTAQELMPEEGEQPLGAAETIAKEFPIQNLDSDPEPDKPADDKPDDESAGDDTGDQPDAAAEEPEKKPGDKTKPPMDWREKRRIEETNKRRAAEERLAEVERELAIYKKPAAAEGDKPATPTISMDEAKRQARLEMEQEQNAKSFREATGRVLQAGLAQFDDFDQVRQEMVANFGDQMNARPDFFEAITDADIPNGHEIFYNLAKDPEQTERLLSMPPVKMAIEIAKLSEKLAKPTAATPKPISKVPPPVKPVGGAAPIAARLDDESLAMDKWADTYLRQIAAKGR